MNTPRDPLFLTPEEAFQRIGIGRSAGYALIKNGTIPSVKLGKLRRIPVAALERWAATAADAVTG